MRSVRPNALNRRALPSPIPTDPTDRLRWLDELDWQVQVDAITTIEALRGHGWAEAEVAGVLDDYEAWLHGRVTGAVDLGRFAAGLERGR